MPVPDHQKFHKSHFDSIMLKFVTTSSLFLTDIIDTTVCLHLSSGLLYVSLQVTVTMVLIPVKLIN